LFACGCTLYKILIRHLHTPCGHVPINNSQTVLKINVILSLLAISVPPSFPIGKSNRKLNQMKTETSKRNNKENIP
jgi:hypothetical protein